MSAVVPGVKRAKARERILKAGRIAILPAYRAAGTILKFGEGVKTDDDFVGLLVELNSQISNVDRGDLSRGEAMLVAQAHTLDAIFHTCARRAALNMGEHLPAAEAYLRFALKAQSQARATWETLAEIKNPRSIAFVQQANVAHGPQQVNNTSAKPDVAGSMPESRKQQDERCEKNDDFRLDNLPSGETSVAGIAVSGRTSRAIGC